MEMILKAFFLPLLCCLGFTASLSAQTTWYVRADGGTRYTANRVAAGLSAQCNGKANAPYSGDGGQNENCAFNDYRFLYDDQATYGVLQWVIAGGDNVILDNSQPWRVGWDSDAGRNESWCYGFGGGPYGCFNPSIPSGTPSQPTRILGKNYAACSIGNAADPTKMTQLFGGHGTYAVLNLTGTQNVQVECLELTRHSDCVVHGSPVAKDCHIPTADGGLQDYDSDGVITDQRTAGLTLQDMWIHGHTDRGIIGPIGGAVTANRINIDTNGMAGWDFDDGSSTPSVNGTLTMHYSTIQFSGCNQQYPFVDKIPVASCYDQSSGGYGDGIGTPAGTGLNVSIDHSLFQYNTQDGADFGHVDTGNYSLNITNSSFVGNMGGNPKWGPAFSTATVVNNLILANCLRMKAPLPGAPSGYNRYLSQFCRAGDGISFESYNGNNTLFAGNSVVTYAPTTIDMQCATQNGVQNCGNTTYTFADNIFRGYDDPATYNLGSQFGGPGMYCGAGCNSSTARIGRITRQNNLYYGFRGSCAANTNPYAAAGTSTQEICADPQFSGEPASFTNEAALDNYNFNLTSGSPAVRAGIAVLPQLTVDYNDATRPNPPSLGALETGAYAAIAPPVSQPTPTPTPPPAPARETTFMSVTLCPLSPTQVYMFVIVTSASGSIPDGNTTLTVDGTSLGQYALTGKGAYGLLLPANVPHPVTVSVNYAGTAVYAPSSATAKQ